MRGTTAPIIGMVLQRMIFDQMIKMSDPDALRKFDQQEAANKTRKGSDYYWHKGDTMPKRTPDFSKLLTLYQREQ